MHLDTTNISKHVSSKKESRENWKSRPNLVIRRAKKTFIIFDRRCISKTYLCVFYEKKKNENKILKNSMTFACM